MVDTRLYEAARLYHLKGETMEAIAKRLRVSRSTVSRLLKAARESGLVRVSLAPDHSATDDLARDVGEAFDVQAHVVAESGGELRRLDAVARVAARLLGEWVDQATWWGWHGARPYRRWSPTWSPARSRA